MALEFIHYIIFVSQGVFSYVYPNLPSYPDPLFVLYMPNINAFETA